MKRLVAPAARIMARLRFSVKFGALAGLFLTPMALVTFFYVKENGNPVVAIAAGSLMLLAVYLLIGVYQSTVESVRKVASTAKVIANGDFTQSVKIESNDEFGDLSRNLQEMSDHLRNVAFAAERIAEGDLRVTFSARSPQDSLGKSLGEMVDNLRSVITNVGSSAALVGTTSEQLRRHAEDTRSAIEEIARAVDEVAQACEQSASASAEMAADCEQQARATDEAAGAMAHLDEAIRLVREMTERHHLHAGEVTKSATDTNKTVERTIDAMRVVQEHVETSSEKVRSLGAKSDQIGAIVETINQIAEQTNLLALNAAIEAARAGEHGRGFAVVADEVRKLAERSGKATEEIGSLIKEVRASVGAALEAMEISQVQVRQTVEQSHLATDSLSDMVQTVISVENEVAALATTAQQMEEGSETVAGAMSQIASLSQTTAAGAQEISATADEISRTTASVSTAVQHQAAAVAAVGASAEELEAMANTLRQAVTRFTLAEARATKLRVAA